MTRLEDLLFPVAKVESHIPANSYCAYDIIGTIDGQPRKLGTCSDRYNLIDNSNLFPIVESLLHSKGVKFEKAYRMVDFSRFYAKYILKKMGDKDLGINVGTDKNPDVIYPTLDMGNSYNGYEYAKGLFGFFRMICSNGMVIPLKGKENENFTFKGRHTKKLSLTFDELFDKIKVFINKHGEVKERIEVLTDRKVEKWSDRLEEVIKATKLKPSKEQLATIEATIRTEASDLGGDVTDWLIYNGINAYIFKAKTSKGAATKATPEVKRKQDIKVFEYMVANN